MTSPTPRTANEATTGFRADLAASLSRGAERLDPGARRSFEAYAQHLFARLGTGRELRFPAETLTSIAIATFHLLEHRHPGPALISAGHATLAPAQGDGRSSHAPSELTVLTVINDDKPFLVSSVMGEIQARGLKTQMVLHPVCAMLRDEAHELKSLKPLSAMGEDDAASGWRAESIIIVVMDALEEGTGRDLMAALKSILGQVDAAVRDWQPMLDRLDRAVAALEEMKAADRAGLIGETIAFCRWMRSGQFVFLGMREYRLDGDPETGSLRVVEGSGLGVLADPNVRVLRRGRELVSLNDEVRRFYLKPSPIIITKSNAQSHIHRRAHMDYVGLKTYAPDGKLSGELRMVGLFTAAAYTDPPTEIPFLRLKVARIFEMTGIRHATHEGRMLHNILDTFPRDELFQIGIEQLASWVPMLLELEFDPRIRAFVRRDRFDRFVSVIVFTPRDRFSTDVRERIGKMLAEVFQGRLVLHQPYFTAGPLVRVHYIIGRYEGATPAADEAELERRIAEITQTWQDKLELALHQLPGTGERYKGAFSASYAEAFPPARAIQDIERIERLGHDGPIAIDFYRSAGADESEVRAAIYCFDAPIPLSERVPVMENLGFSVIDERTYLIAPRLDGASRHVCLHDMMLKIALPRALDLTRIELDLEQAFTAVFTSRADDDPFNRLVMAADATWRDAAMLRAYAAYMRQIGLPYDRDAVAETLAKHADRAADIIRYFKSRFDPEITATPEDRDRVEQELKASFEAHLAEVPSLDEDRILRTLLGLVGATVRTNFFQVDTEDAPPSVIAFKIASKDVVDAPEPRPFREIWVSGPEVDGVHLRFAPIARGGLRWSDRAHDFRTEVLGLAKAQQVKNTVIVPQGAKGGFVPKRLPKNGARDEIMKVGVAAYSTFVSTLLSLTDNIVDGKIVPPAGVVRRDDDDPYLVVAADKGTATFSDYANAISEKHGFWLGDAFASGGSAGYDHKKMGITARGAWEGVERHFREMDHDIQSRPFTVAGIGDMSGDVFGNGMLLSRHIRLVAAFDHRDIFIDPDPEIETSFAERERLFQLPRSSWQDYDKTQLSLGGGIFSRGLKSIALTPQIRTLLNLDQDRATPSEVMRAILAANVDLFWFGGIGTYVRGDHETDADVGDRGNDAIRIPAARFGARVVGEGANLGLTQRARIDFARRGGRLNTDFIDNSAGVNSSDQEVNIKIALAPATASGRLDTSTRNTLLAGMTEDVAAACLANNYAQTLAISLAERRGASGMADHLHLIHELERRGLLHRALEALPDDAALSDRQAAGSGLTRPELAVLMSYAKLALSYDLIASGIPDNPAVAYELSSYFPSALQQSYAQDIAAHPLKREIVTTALTNRIINLGGIDLPTRLADDWNLDVDRMAQATMTALAVLDASTLFDQIDACDNRIPGALQLQLYDEVQRQLRARAAWQSAEHRHMPPLADAIVRQRHAFVALDASFERWATPERQQQRMTAVQDWVAAGTPRPIAETLARNAALAESGDICLIAESLLAARKSNLPASPNDIESAAAIYAVIGDHLRLTILKQRARETPASDRFDRLAINSALAGLAASHRAMARVMLQGNGGDGPAALAAWRQDAGGQVAIATRRLADLVDSGPLSVARLTVAAAVVRELADTLRAATSSAA